MSPDGSYTSLDVTFSSAPTNGNSLFMAVGAASAEVSAINQTGATWAKANGFYVFGSTLDLWVAQNITGAGVTATIVLTGSTYVAGILVEYSDLKQIGDIVDQTGGIAVGSSSVNMDSGGTTTQSDELLITVVGNIGGSLQENPTNGFTEVNQILQAGTRRLGFYNRIVSATDFYNTSIDITPPNPALGFMTTFFASVGAPSFNAFLAAALPKKMG